MFNRKIVERKGGTIIIIVMMLTILFPIVITGIIDITNMFKIQKRLKTVLNASVKSASSRVDWSSVPDGEFKIDEGKAEEAFVDIFNSNMDVELEKEENIYKCKSAKNGYPIYLYFDVYNERHKDSFVNFPEEGTIPSEITDKHLYTQVDRPTAIAVSRVEYKVSPFLGGKVFNLIQFASSQLNIAPDVGETVESNVDEEGLPPGQPVVSNQNLIDSHKDFTANNTYYDVVKTNDILNSHVVYKAQKKSSTDSPIHIGLIHMAPGETYTASLWIKADNHNVLQHTSMLGFFTNTGTTLSTAHTTRVGEWIRLQVTFINSTGGVLPDVEIRFYPAKAAGSITYFAFPKVEVGKEATD